MVIKEVLEIGRKKLLKNDVDVREARLLLAVVMNINIGELLSKETCTDEEYKKFMLYIEKRISGEPYAYIVGYKEFMKLNFKVNEHVLIPREDTEILVENAINSGKLKILDICTGSGCIAISLAKYIKNSIVDAVDISSEALKVAKENASLNNVNVNFINSNLFENVKEKYDLIVSNPPYIPSDDILFLQKEVKNEPLIALDGGKDGLTFYKLIAQNARNHLNDGGILMFEIGFDEAESVSNILQTNGYKNITVIKDFSGNDRVVKADY